MRTCACGRDATCLLEYEESTRMGITTKRPAAKCTRCADKEAFAVLGRGVDFVKARRVA